MTRIKKIVSAAVLVGITATGGGIYAWTVALDPEQQAWCCLSTGGGCVPVDSLAECAVDKIAVWCEHGHSSPVSNADGTDSFECLE